MESSKNYCIDSCKEKRLFFFKDDTSKLCIDKCRKTIVSDGGTEDNKYYNYNPTTNECVEDCGDTINFVFYEKATSTEDKSCLISCPSGKFYDYNSHECIDKCGEDDPDNKYHAINDNVCYPSCKDIPGGSYIYQIIDDSTIQNYKCSTLESDCNFYYYKKSDGIYECQTSNTCPSAPTSYYYLKGKECLTNCNEYYTLDMPDTLSGSSLVKCYETLEDCFISGLAVYYHTASKQCWTNFPSSNYYITKTIDGKSEIIKNCVKFIYHDSSTSLDYCIDNCKDKGQYFIGSNNLCQANCVDTDSDIHYFYYDPTNNQCLEDCESSANYKFSYLSGTGSENTPVACLSECSSGQYYNYGSYKCKDSCDTSTDSAHKYHAFNGYVCYNSCKDIPGGPYIYENNYVCYTMESTCSNYYVKLNDVVNCVSQCNSNSYENRHFSLGKECLANCDNYFKLDYTASGVTKCFSTLDDCISSGNAKYYEISSKKCWTSLSSLSSTGIFLKRIREGIYEVVTVCEKYYYLGSDSQKYCVDSCKEVNKYFKSGTQKCEDDCNQFTSDNLHYYDPNNNECLASCAGRNNLEFSFKYDTTASPAPAPLSCLSECPSTSYYDFNSKICINKCGLETSTYKYHAINSNVCYASCKDIPGDSFIYEITENDDTFTCSNLEGSCSYYYSNSGIKKCVSSENDCLNFSPNPKKYLLGKECLESCEGYYILEKPSNIDTTTPASLVNCYETLEDCLSVSGVTYYDINLKLCYKSGSSNLPSPYIQKKIGNFYEIVTECPYFYYKNINDNNYNYCIESCKEKDLYFKSGEKECKARCDFSVDPISYYYYDPSNNECLQKCNRYNLEFAEQATTSDNHKECKSECPDGKFYYEEDKFILGTCNSGDYISYSNPKLCVNKCNEGEKVNGNKCVQSCDSNYYKDTNEGSWDKYICVSLCSSITTDDYSKTDVKTKECLTTCDSNYYYEYENLCIPKCPSNNHYIDSTTFECVASCPKELPKHILLTGSTDTYICLTNCKENEYSYAGECLNECPSDNNAIGYNNICKPKENCKDDLNGPYYYKFADSTSISTPTYSIYKCISSCEVTNGLATSFLYYTELNPYECIQSCPSQSTDKYKFHIDNQYKCISECPEDYPFYDSSGSLPYVCKSVTSCTEFYYNGQCTTDCISLSTAKRFINSDKICVEKCEEGEYLEKHGTINNLYYCRSTCDPSKYKYRASELETDNFECVDKCPQGKNYIGLNNICRQSCDEEGYLNYYDVTPGGLAYKIYKCVSECKETYHLHLYPNSVQCYDSCITGYEYKSEEEHKCYTNCYDSEKNPFLVTKTTGGVTEKLCKKACDETTGKKRYSKTDYICKEKCEGALPYLIEGTNECLPDCPEGDFKKVITADAPDYKEGEIVCVKTYSSFYYYSTDRILHTACNTGDYALADTHECVSNCEADNYYYYNHEAPPSGVVITYTQNTCVKQCPPEKNYLLDNKKCVKHCPSGTSDSVDYPNYTYDKRFFIDNYFKNCATDCTTDNPYLIEGTETIFGATTNIYKCTGSNSGRSYLINENPNIIAKKLLPADKTCREENYYSNENNEKECYASCPSDKYIYEDEKKCVRECPDGYYHEKNSKLCIKPDSCTSRKADYETKECVDSCGTKHISNYVGGTTSAEICLFNCNERYGIYLTPDGKCVDDCEAYTGIGNLKRDTDTNKCVCENYYYIGDNSIMVCLSSTYTDCKQNTANSYTLLKYGTKQCLKVCDTIKSVNGDICYESSSDACKANEDRYSALLGNQCKCRYKWYKDSSNNNRITCLAENDLCPRDYNYIPVTKECVLSCPSPDYPKIFNKFCLNKCPKDSTETSNVCSCENKNWAEVSDGNFECLVGDCRDSYRFSAPETKQCLKGCVNSYYPNFFESKCYSDCSLIDPALAVNTNPVEIDNEYYKHICKCTDPWYYDGKKMTCPPASDNINDCSQYTGKEFKFMIKDTLQCVKECPTEYPYYFNKLCFKSCENEGGYNVKTVESSNECQCANLWYYEDTDKTIKKCLDETITECIEFSTVYKYKIDKTKECVTDKTECPTNSYIFNYICYDQCPEFTVDSTNSHDCACDKETWLWYEYEKHDRTYLACGLEECPSVNINIGNEQYSRINFLEKENKCVASCSEDTEYKVAFRNVCVKECPEKTNEVVDKCLFYNLNDEDYIRNLEEMKSAANIQAKELYEQSSQYSGYTMNKFDASLQIYAINKLNTYKNLAMKSNLTYIDLGTCLNKIYEDGTIPDNDKILVVKFDLLTREKPTNTENNEETPAEGYTPNEESSTESSDEQKFMINPVEYEFYQMSNMKKIDGAICSPYEILISYPISFNKNRFNQFVGGINQNDYMKKFEIGKQLHKENSEIDTFNSENKVYKDLCVGVEINGKDLVLEDRLNNLYPNNISLCESNCTMDSTDFDLERINCKCTYKEIIDFKRIDERTNDIINDPNYEKASQSGANAQIIKCISKISLKQGIIKNEVFYYSLVISVVEVGMIFVSFLSGIQSVTGFVQGMLNLNVPKPGLNTGNRMINNPPKKGDNGEDENDDKNIDNDNNVNNKGNIIIKKNIKMNYNINTQNDTSENNSEISDNKNINYGINIKSEFTKNNQTNVNNTQLNNLFSTNNFYKNKKAEFIPQKYNFKFFKPNDKGVVKKIQRTQIPFSVKADTKILLECKKDVIYGDDYLEGPFYEDQNIIEIIEDKNDEKKIIKYNNNDYNDNINNDDNSIKLKNKLNKKNEEVSRTKKRTITNNLNSEEKDFITIKKINPINKAKLYNKITVEDYKEEDEIKKVDDTTSIYNLMKREHTYLRVTYEKYMAKNHPNILSIFLAEILDKIYFIKIFIFLKKFEIFSVQLALYMFYHILLLSLLCGFFTVSTIKKIWEDSNYPSMNFYLLYGFLGNLIIWAIYRIFSLMIDNQDRIRALVKLNSEENAKENEDDNIDNNKETIKEKFEKLIKKIKIQTVVFYILILIITGFCFVYLVSFFAIYTGTKGKVFKAYYISIIEIILIKFVYGLCLASLRIGAEGNELKSLYKFVYTCDKYLS